MNDVKTAAGTTGTGLLAADEPAPYHVYNPRGSAPVLLLCDHADNFIPRALDRLGLNDEHLERHIAYDIGIAPVTEMMADALDAPAVFSHFSRLIVDPNRQLDDPTLMPQVADGTVVPGNEDLGGDAVEARLAAFFRPYHDAVERQLDSMQTAARRPAVISMHSFTPVMRGRERPWHVGVLWDSDERLPVPLMRRLAAQGYCVGDNEPYSGRDGHGYTQHVHADRRGLANALIELRQDLIDTRHGQREWADIMIDALRPLLDDPALYRPSGS
ncbi:N-formylglutamate amidohydrolase [Ferruginivarius sediminum]|uniref:N-formylglutamate amidohydrolase n=1 Tax=Ferruginivarius sediminum TaxID=2661937 RepID=A0A369TC65_9PROT|nr:N-formylglutamate amidohydrolase [Ferruginivarius sediminum]RDD61757.1 N-formylglutamate amidohydrolase [Ferruginivarius sediminum]